jgi:FkbM family methyltransferase
MIKEKISGYRVSFAQNREDIILASFFENTKKGFYVDVGANDPEVDSVTKYFYMRGWSGINLEPQAVHYRALKEHRPRDINLNVGVGSEKGELSLRQYEGDGLSTFSEDMKYDYIKESTPLTNNFIDTPIAIKTLETILGECNVNIIQFMKIDVEGFEYEVLKGNNWNIYRPEVICIESNHITNDWHAFMKKQDYNVAFFDGLNEYLVDARKPEVAARFSYVDSMILGEPFINRPVAQLLNNKDELLQMLTGDLESVRHDLRSQINHSLYLQQELDQIISLKQHIKKYTNKQLRMINTKIEQKIQARQKFISDIPNDVGDVLDRAKASDLRNLNNYNGVFSSNRSLKQYRQIKYVAKRMLGKK